MTSKEALNELKKYKYSEINLYYENKLFETIKKDLEVLELLKNKKVDIAELECCLRLYPKNYLQPMSEYNKHIWNYNLKLVKEEYDILRKWLNERL